MKVWTISNQKGGVGKTTTVATIAGLLSKRQYRVLIIDIDPHASLTSYFGFDPDAVNGGTYALFRDDDAVMQRLIKATRFSNISIIPSTMALATIDRQMGNQQGKGMLLRRALRQVENDYDYVLIDCPPMLGILIVNALAACDHLIIPVQTEFLALKGLDRMLRTLELITRSRKKTLNYTIVPTMFDCRTRASKKTLQVLRDDYRYGLWESCIPIDTQFREASSAGVPLSIQLPESRGAIAYAELVASLMAMSTRVHSREVIGI